MSHRNVRPIAFIAVVLCLFIVRSTNVSATTTYTVDTGVDIPDQAENYCVTHTGPCTLRMAILAANITTGHDTIAFNQAVFANDRTVLITRDLPFIDSAQGVTVDGGTDFIRIGPAINSSLNYGLVFYTGLGVPLQDVSVKYIYTHNTLYDGIQVCGGVNHQTVACEGTVSNVTLDHVSTYFSSVGIRILGSAISDVHLTDAVASYNHDGPNILIQSNPGSISNLSLTGAVSTGQFGDLAHDGVRIIAGDPPNTPAAIDGLTITDFTQFVSSGDGIKVIGSDVQNVRVDGINVGANDFAGLDIGSQTLQHVLVTNSIFGSGRSGIDLAADSATAQSSDIHIDNNTVTGANVGIEVSAPVLNDTLIENNTVNSGSGQGIVLYGFNDAGSGNIIRNSIVTGHLTGVELHGELQSTITRNSIHDNTGLGIDLYSSSSGVTLNDPGDTDTGPNGLLNYPVVTIVTPEQMSGTACANCLVELFVAAPDPTGYGEGKTFLRDATADASGNFEISLCQLNLAAGTVLTSTATDPAGETSEFALNYSLQQATSTTCVAPTATPIATVTQAPTATPTPTATPVGQTPTPTPTPGGPTATPLGGQHKQGDLNCDGSVKANDALRPIRFSAGIPLSQPGGCPALDAGDPDFADVNCDGNIGPGDTVALLEHVASVPIQPPQPGGCTPLGQPLPS
jgi:parallel beta-helix repeat protein